MKKRVHLFETNDKKLSGKAQINRMLKLAGVSEPTKQVNESTEGTSRGNVVYTKTAPNGTTFAIIKENKTYFVKTSDTPNAINESQFDYIGGLRSKMTEAHSSYSVALKRLNLKLADISEAMGVKDGVELLSEDKKYVLRQPKPATEPEMDLGGDDDFGDLGDDSDLDFGDDEGFDEEPMDDEESFDEEPMDDDEEDPVKSIEKLTGTLAQEIRDAEDELSDKKEKYIINSIIAALDLTDMSADDIDDIIAKIKDNAEGEDSDKSDTTDDEFADMSDDSEDLEGEDEFADLESDLEEMTGIVDFDGVADYAPTDMSYGDTGHECAMVHPNQTHADWESEQGSGGCGCQMESTELDLESIIKESVIRATKK